jgi:uncharacterized protein (DUF1810 family)
MPGTQSNMELALPGFERSGIHMRRRWPRRVGVSGVADDPFDLRRFVEAQASVHAQALAELRRGRKQGHWMWFVFPQIEGLGLSDMARRFAIRSRDEAVAYLEHPVLGPRLREFVDATLSHHGKTAIEILGEVDAMKFCSCLTLFAAAAPDERRFREALERYCGGEDARTLERLARS